MSKPEDLVPTRETSERLKAAGLELSARLVAVVKDVELQQDLATKLAAIRAILDGKPVMYNVLVSGKARKEEHGLEFDSVVVLSCVFDGLNKGVRYFGRAGKLEAEDVREG